VSMMLDTTGELGEQYTVLLVSWLSRIFDATDR
jgi:hypothetical protein